MHSEQKNIRPVLPDELIELLTLYNRSRASAGCYAGGEINFNAFSASVEGEEIHVATVDGVVAGFVSVWAPERFVHHLYVSPQHQSTGVGSALLKACEELYGLPLSLKCDTCNHRAQRFYRNRGWLPKGAGVGEDGPWEELFSPRA